MTEQIREKIEQYFAAHAAQMFQDIASLVEIPSTRAPAQPGMPYGLGPHLALQRGLELMQEKSLKTKTWDGHVVTGDLTDLEPGLDILAHLDVVPAEGNWTVCEPYHPVLKDGRLYGRGAMDDKGPAMAALYAIDCVRTLGIPLRRNVRLIFGADEECGSEDVAYYYTKQPEAPMTFTPDGSFPLINVEKGSLMGEIDGAYAQSQALPRLIRAEAGVKINVIPETAQATIAGMDLAALQPYLDQAAQQTGAHFSAQMQQDGQCLLSCRGENGHAAYPEKANNALTALLYLLVQLPFAKSEATEKLHKLQSLFPHGVWDGSPLGIAMQDAVSGSLTLSPDLLQIDETHLYLAFDARCPACSNEENTKKAAQQAVAAAGLSMRDRKMVLPHVVPDDSDFVRTLLRVYTEWTGKPGIAQRTGGASYAHDLKRGVAFGCGMAEIENHAHGADEFADVDQILLSAKIFTQVIIELCC